MHAMVREQQRNADEKRISTERRGYAGTREQMLIFYTLSQFAGLAPILWTPW
jgi:hypothetical protein